MATDTLVIIYIAIGIVCGSYAAYVASDKGYSSVAWFFGGLFFGIFALIASAGSPVKSMAGKLDSSKQESWKCPKCGHLNAAWDRNCQNKIDRGDGVKVWCHTPKSE